MIYKRVETPSDNDRRAVHFLSAECESKDLEIDMLKVKLAFWVKEAERLKRYTIMYNIRRLYVCFKSKIIKGKVF